MAVRRYPGIFEYYNCTQFEEHTQDSTVLINTYWICTDMDFMKSIKQGVWQYHSNKGVAESISSQLPGTTVRFMEFAYIPKEPKRIDNAK